MPGVPPETVDNVKRLLKGIFRRGKNKKQGQPTQQSSPSHPATNPPAVQSSTSNGTAPAVDKPLPPTHPLASGQHEKPQEAVSQNHAAQPGPVPSAQDVKKAEGEGVSPASPLTATQQQPIAAALEEKPPAPPPKNDGAFDAPQPIDTSANKENVPATSNATLSDSAMATPNTPAKPEGVVEETKLAPASTTAPAIESQTKPLVVEEKVPVHAEPAATKTNPPTATGMSATSGPLEDFPVHLDGDKE